MRPTIRHTHTPVTDPWASVSAARFPAQSLVALGPVRDRADVRVYLGGPVIWARWPVGLGAVVHCLLPVPGVEFFSARGEGWSRFRSRLPCVDQPPAGDGLPVAAVLSPAPLVPSQPVGPVPMPLRLGIARGGPPRSVTAMTCRTVDLVRWADTATTAELTAVRAACAGPRALLLGQRLPSVPDGGRFWGQDLLVPVGFRPDPDLPAAVVRSAVGASAEEIVLLQETGADVVPRGAFAPLTRAGVRLAARSLGVEEARP
jgi:hypothetical protein